MAGIPWKHFQRCAKTAAMQHFLISLALLLLLFCSALKEAHGAASSRFIDEVLQQHASILHVQTAHEASTQGNHFAHSSGTRVNIPKDGQGFNNIDALFIVNLKHREDRRRDIDAMFRSLGVTKH